MSEEVKTRGRKSVLAGKKLTSACDENPRKAGSKGHASHAIVMENPGITYEEFRAKGGHPGYAKLDVEEGYMVAE